MRSVRQAAILAVVPLQLQAAVPRLLELAAKPGSPDYATAVEALCGLPDPRAVGVYLAALEDANPRLRKLAESASWPFVTRCTQTSSLPRNRDALRPGEALHSTAFSRVHADRELASARAHFLEICHSS